MNSNKNISFSKKGKTKKICEIWNFKIKIKSQNIKIKKTKLSQVYKLT